MLYLAIVLVKLLKRKIMDIVNLIRTESGNEGTFGKLIAANKVFSTVEPPWEDNEHDVSCIPYGEYKCEITHSHKYGRVYEVKDVEGRTHILMHWGNWGGDKELGFISDTDGCIIVGQERGVINGQKAVAKSRLALNKFMVLMDGKPFTLIISGFDIW